MEQDEPQPKPGQPTFGRVLLVAAGMAEWTEKEQAFLAANPKWKRYEQEFRDAIAKLDEARNAKANFIDRVSKRTRDGTQSVE